MPDEDYAAYRQAAIESHRAAREKVAIATAPEYAAMTGAMSYPVGVAKAVIEAEQQVACEAADADYVRAFMRALEDPEIRLVTEKPHDWTNHGTKAKAAILAALKRGRP